MDKMTIKKKEDIPNTSSSCALSSSRLSGASLSKSFPGALYSPRKPDPVPDPPPKRLSLLSDTDHDLQPLSWLVSPNLLHNVCGRPQHTKPPPPKRLISRSATTGGRFSMMNHFKLAPKSSSSVPVRSSCEKKTVQIRTFRTIRLPPRIIKTEAPEAGNRNMASARYPPSQRHPPPSQRHTPYSRAGSAAASPRHKLYHRYHDPKRMKSKYTKPPYSFATLIFMAIEESPTKKLPVKDIYNWILDRFPYYRMCDRGWRNSVRHNLSLNRCFKRIDKDRRLECGKGSWWTLDPELRPELVQAFKKLGNVNMIPGPIGTENITPPNSPPFHTPPSSPINTEEEAAAAALCLMKRKSESSRNKSDSERRVPATGSPAYSTTPSSSESSPEQMPPLDSLPKARPRPTTRASGPKRSIIIDKKSAEGVWALLEMANSR